MENWLDIELAIDAYRTGVHGPLSSIHHGVLYRLKRGYLTPKEALDRLDALSSVMKKPEA